MELILINESKLKIMLSKKDMEHYELCNEEIDYDCTETRKAFWQILDDAKHQTGFDAASEKVFIQLYPSREGGCEMYVTKVTSPVGALGKKESSMRTAEVRVGRQGCYSFHSMRALLQVCAGLHERGYREDSSAYLTDDGRYVLFIREFEKKRWSFACEPDTYSFIEEFGNRERAREKQMYLKEHGTCLCETDAVHILAQLF